MIEEIEEIFAYWKDLTGHEKARLDEVRKKTLRARLADGYSADDLKLAIEGCAASSFHRGENDRNCVYDSIALIFRNADQVDKFISLGERAREIIEKKKARTRAQEISKEELSSVSIGDSVEPKSAWWTSERGIKEQGNKLGLTPYPGETFEQFKSRIIELQRRSA